MNRQPESLARVSRSSLWFGVLAAPFAWSAQELFSYLLASRLCRLRAEGFAPDQVHALSTPFVLTTAITLAIALAGSWTAIGNWRRVREARRDSSRNLDEAGVERTRFLSRCGAINSVVFIVAFFFTTADLLVAPLCGK